MTEILRAKPKEVGQERKITRAWVHGNGLERGSRFIMKGVRHCHERLHKR